MNPLHDVNAGGPVRRSAWRPQPRRSGQPWTDDDYERLVTLVREGQDVPAIAGALGRTEGAVTPRLRALLPPEQRAILADRVLTTLRGHVQDRPDYPWAEIMVQLPPPAPVVEEVVHRAGVAGLEADLLVEAAWAMLHCETAEAEAVREVCLEVEARGLDDLLVERLGTALVSRVPPVTPDEAHHAAMTRFDLACGRRIRPDPYRYRPYDAGW
jgi:hypothetical protein